MNCLNCRFARHAENEEYVGCAKMLLALGEHYAESNPCCFYDRDLICTGWVNLSKPPDDTSKQGMITNGIPCFKKDDICKHYEAKEM